MTAACAPVAFLLLDSRHRIISDKTAATQNCKRVAPSARVTPHGKEITVSGFGLWSVLNPRIERYLDDPSRAAEPASRRLRVEPVDSAAIARASASLESGLAEDSATPALVAQSRAA